MEPKNNFQKELIEEALAAYKRQVDPEIEALIDRGTVLFEFRDSYYLYIKQTEDGVSAIFSVPEDPEDGYNLVVADYDFPVDWPSLNKAVAGASDMARSLAE